METHKPPSSTDDLLSAQECCQLLGIKPATLYTYVSRGLITPTRQPDRKQNRYLREEVESLRLRSSARHGHGAVAATAMRWGQPVMETAICDIGAEGPRYRGHLATDLVREGAFENVAELLWSGVLTHNRHAWPVEPPHVDLRTALAGMLQQGRTKPRMMRVFSIAATALGGGTLAEELRTGAMPQCARQLLFAFSGCCGLLGPTGDFELPSGERPMAQHVLRALGASVTAEAEHAINAALILGAEHELSSGTFAARIAASAGSTLNACVVAALATQQGALSAGGGDAAEELMDGIRSAEDVDRRLAIADQRRERLAGFGLAIYPDGDPRARCLIQLAKQTAPGSHRADLAYAFVERATRQLGIHPNIEIGLVVLALAWKLPPRTACALWGIGRTAGWVAHVMEQRLAGLPIRPRGHYQSHGR